jgi:hypothetical protein
VATGAGGWMSIKYSCRSGGEKCFLLDIPFNRTSRPSDGKRVSQRLTNRARLRPSSFTTLGLASGEGFWGLSPEIATNRQSGFVNTAPLIAGNRRGHVYLLGFCEVTRHFHE